MRQFNFIALAFLGGCSVFSAQAAKLDASNPCALLQWQDIEALGVTQDTKMTQVGWQQEANPKGIPAGQLLTNMCAVGIKSDAGRSSFTLNLDIFRGKVSEQQVTDWLISTIAADEPEESAPTIVKLGNVTCESGKYDLPTSQKDGSVVNVVEHYIACDEQVGTQHISVNAHVPEAEKTRLFSPEQAKLLLEKTVSRMKETAFAPPGIKI